MYEVTLATHRGRERNARDTGGCLGADLGDSPDLANLTCCFVPVAENDVVFLCSDGVSDNFDPVILKEAASEAPHPHPAAAATAAGPKTRDFSTSLPALAVTKATTSPTSGPAGRPIPTPSTESARLPYLSPEQRQALSLMKLTKLLKSRQSGRRRALTASEVCEAIISYVIEVSDEKRHYLEQMWARVEGRELTVAQRRENDRRVAQEIKLLPGKLDHATVAVYKIGRLNAVGEMEARSGHSPTHSYHMNSAVTAATAQTVGDARRHLSFSQTGGSIFYCPNPPSSSSPDHQQQQRQHHDEERVLDRRHEKSGVV